MARKSGELTIGREIKRNRLDNGEYIARYAQISTRLRYQQKSKNKKLNRAHQRYIHAKLKEGWSPQQIAGRMSLDGLVSLSHETIYRYIYRRIREGQKELALYLRHKHRKYQRIIRRRPISNNKSSDEKDVSC